MANDIYQNNVLPDGTLRPQASAGKVDNPLDPLRDTANILHELDYRYKKIQAQNEQAKQDQFESDLQLKQAEFNEQLKTITNQQEFDDAIAKYNSDIDTLGVNVMGEAGYKKWSNEKGRNYKQLSSLGYKSIWAKNMQKQTYASVETAVDNYAVLASMQSDPDRRKFYINKANGDIKSEVLDPEQKVALTNRFNMQLANAEVVRDINNDPQKAIDNLQAVDEKNKKPAYYDGLTPVQRQNYLRQAKNKYEAIKNSINQPSLEPLKNKFIADYTNSKQQALQWLDDIKKNRLETMEQLGIENKQFDIFVSWADKIINSDDELALQKQTAFDETEDRYSEFGIYRDKKKTMKLKVGNKYLNNIESISAMLNEIDINIANKTFTGNNLNKAVKYQRNLYSVLGEMIANDNIKIKKENDLWFRDSVSEDIPKQLNAIIQRQFGDVLSLDEVGYIYSRVYANCVAQGIDGATMDKNIKDSVRKNIIVPIFADFIRQKYDIPDFNIDGVINGGKLISLQDRINRQQIQGLPGVNAYGKYNLNGKVLELKDSNGNIVDTIEY